MIHPTAIVSPEAVIGENVTIGPYAVIGDDVTIGNHTTIGAHAVIDSHTTIGEHCQIFQFASIGAAPQSLKYQGEPTRAVIGDYTVIREFATVNRGTVEGGGVTTVGDHNLLMAYSHVAHDCQTGHHTILANVATLAGHIVLGNHVTVGGLVAIHQFVRVGDYAFIGGKSAVVKDIPPFVIAAGDRATLHGLNTVGLSRQGFSPEELARLKKAYRIVFRIGLTLKEAIERVKAEVEMTKEVACFVSFLQNSERGITR
ncbi:MAG: acyl-ACP--UDP-N-acetylglucosamine O-acyltransferase [Thermodesulfobacteriota bacterium]